MPTWTDYATEAMNDFIDGEDRIYYMVTGAANEYQFRRDMFVYYLRAFLSHVIISRATTKKMDATMSFLDNVDWQSLAEYYLDSVDHSGAFYPL